MLGKQADSRGGGEGEIAPSFPQSFNSICGQDRISFASPGDSGTLPRADLLAQSGGRGLHGFSYQRSPVEQCNVSDAHFQGRFLKLIARQLPDELIDR